nr:uncharacterized protein LOC109172462 [Ipomoea batatas]
MMSLIGVASKLQKDYLVVISPTGIAHLNFIIFWIIAALGLVVTGCGGLRGGPKRTQSEKFSVDKVATENRGELRRSEREKCRRVADPVDIPAETAYTVDELSNEEFNRTIEDFIAKQIKFHQEEKMKRNALSLFYSALAL